MHCRFNGVSPAIQEVTRPGLGISGFGAGTLAIRPGGEILGAVCENGVEAEIDNIVSTKKDNHERSGAVASVLGS